MCSLIEACFSNHLNPVYSTDQGEELGRLHRALAKVVCDPDWKVHEHEINLDGSILSIEVDKKPKENLKPNAGVERKIKKFKKSPFEEEKVSCGFILLLFWLNFYVNVLHNRFTIFLR